MNGKIAGGFENLTNYKKEDDECIDVELNNTRRFIIEMVGKITDKQRLRYIYIIVSDIINEHNNRGA